MVQIATHRDVVRAFDTSRQINFQVSRRPRRDHDLFTSRESQLDPVRYVNFVARNALRHFVLKGGTMKRSRLLLGLLLAASFAVPAQAQDAAFSVSGTPDTLGNPPFTLGYSFSLSDQFTATGLGLFDAAGDGLASRHEIGLWDSGGNLLASTLVFGTTGTLNDTFRYNSIAPLLLSAGSYTLGATFTDGLDPFYYDSVLTPLSGVSFGQSRYAAGSALTNPTVSVGGNAYFGPNVLLTSNAAVPEPATWAMMLLGFGLAGAAMRTAKRCQKVVVSYA